MVDHTALSLVLSVDGISINLIRCFSRQTFNRNLKSIIGSILEFRGCFSSGLSDLPFHLISNSELLKLRATRILYLTLDRQAIFPNPDSQRLFQFWGRIRQGSELLNRCASNNSGTITGIHTIIIFSIGLQIGQSYFAKPTRIRSDRSSYRIFCRHCGSSGIHKSAFKRTQSIGNDDTPP
ncbi:hypothetical protein M108_4176 [Bacteroides fragilis str. 3397 T14]|nr:hypothetical protein M108_4176 [Bacteroides fragilis str. 3397 T14]